MNIYEGIVLFNEVNLNCNIGYIIVRDLAVNFKIVNQRVHLIFQFHFLYWVYYIAYHDKNNRLSEKEIKRMNYTHTWSWSLKSSSICKIICQGQKQGIDTCYLSWQNLYEVIIIFLVSQNSVHDFKNYKCILMQCRSSFFTQF